MATKKDAALKADQPKAEVVAPKPDGYVFGRPTGYDPSYCEKVIEWGKQGKSLLWMASELEVARSTFQFWAAAHPDFLVALQRAKEAWQLVEQQKGLDHLIIKPDGDRLDTTLYKFFMASWFREDYAEAKADTNINIGKDFTVNLPVEPGYTAAKAAIKKKNGN